MSDYRTYLYPWDKISSIEALVIHVCFQSNVSDKSYYRCFHNFFAERNDEDKDYNSADDEDSDEVSDDSEESDSDEEGEWLHQIWIDLKLSSNDMQRSKFHVTNIYCPFKPTISHAYLSFIWYENHISWFQNHDGKNWMKSPLVTNIDVRQVSLWCIAKDIISFLSHTQNWPVTDKVQEFK